MAKKLSKKKVTSINKPVIVDDDPDLGEGMSDSDVNSLEDGMFEETLGSSPLTNKKHEHFAMLLFQGNPQLIAYKEAISSSCTQETAKVEGKRLAASEKIKNRIAYLRGKIDELDFPAERMEAIKFVSKIMRSTNKPTALRLQALDRLSKMCGWFETKPVDPNKEKKIDPVWFAEYVKKATKNILVSSPEE